MREVAEARVGLDPPQDLEPIPSSQIWLPGQAPRDPAAHDRLPAAGGWGGSASESADRRRLREPRELPDDARPAAAAARRTPRRTTATSRGEAKRQLAQPRERQYDLDVDAHPLVCHVNRIRACDVLDADSNPLLVRHAHGIRAGDELGPLRGCHLVYVCVFQSAKTFLLDPIRRLRVASGGAEAPVG